MPARTKATARRPPTPKQQQKKQLASLDRRKSAALTLLMNVGGWLLFQGQGSKWLWKIPGTPVKGQPVTYVVYAGSIDERGSCTCPDFQALPAPQRCKHVIAARAYARVARANKAHRAVVEAAREKNDGTSAAR
jgi:hypothetical protein